MKTKENFKKVWKLIMGILLKIYTWNYKLYISNYLPKNNTHKYYSQFGQDIFVLEKFSNNRDQKIFIDVGANHPINGNNTYLLELKGWEGLAIEPQEKLRKLWPVMRKTKCLNYIIGPENKMMDFIEAGADKNGLSGVVGFNKCQDTDCRKITVQQRRLVDILTENKISKVDYLSIDVEGYEMNVLKSINFQKVNITLISIENDLGFKWLPLIGKQLGKELGDNKIRKFLKKEGYQYIARIMNDDFFIKV